MINRLRSIAFALPSLLISVFLSGQVMTIPSSGYGNIGNYNLGTSGMPVGLDLISNEQMVNNLWGMNANMKNHVGENNISSISKFDLKAPSKARHEYEKGYQLLLRKENQDAVDHLTKAVEIYPNFVAAHNALGSAYLNLGQNDKAEQEFSRAVALDDHLPNSHLNLGVAQLALKNYVAAEESLQKASAIAPLDTSLKQALAYGALANKDYPSVIETTRQLHKHKHEGTAVVHYFAAGAWQAQNNLLQAQQELETLLREEPKSPAADQVRQLLLQLKQEDAGQPQASGEPKETTVTFTDSTPQQPTSEEGTAQARRILQDLKEKGEIADAEAANAEPVCPNCEISSSGSTREPASHPATTVGGSKLAGTALRASVDEVNVFFTATDHGKAVTDLTQSGFEIRDNRKAPEKVRGFRTETELPLRLGLVIDISDSVSHRFAFEQKAASEFLQKTLTGKDDLGFIVGVNNSVLLAQDFTADQSKMEHAIGQLVPAGGTALWDAVGFASEKLASLPDLTPVARVLIVISDGENNSSVSTLRNAIEQAQHAEVAVYTISTRDYVTNDPSAATGDQALRTLSELTGGAAFAPSSIRWLSRSMAEIQQALRGRYMVSYKPASFQRNGQYRAIDISAEKDGHKLRIYARKGYYASARDSHSDTP